MQLRRNPIANELHSRYGAPATSAEAAMARKSPVVTELVWEVPSATRRAVKAGVVAAVASIGLVAFVL